MASAPKSVTAYDSLTLITFKASYPVCFKQCFKSLWFDHIEFAVVIHYAYQHCVLLAHGYIGFIQIGKCKKLHTINVHSKNKAKYLHTLNQHLTDIKLKCLHPCKLFRQSSMQ